MKQGDKVRVVYDVSIKGSIGTVLEQVGGFKTPTVLVYIADAELPKNGPDWSGFNKWAIPEHGLEGIE